MGIGTDRDTAAIGNMTTVTEAIDIDAPAETVFAYVDDIRNMGWHMTERPSMAMMGSRLKLDILSERTTGVGATYRYSGTMLGFTLDFSETVTSYVPNREKAWHTIGEPRLVIIASYDMRLLVEPRSPSSSSLTISIRYALPRAWVGRVLGLMLAGPYSRWCLRRMIRDTKRSLEAATRVSAPAMIDMTSRRP
jgi:Polyketide cyclase / dehydrase and lipid transport